jgi:NAD(P)-dependent dehydrogenase (short-subunit alcohol dehydrogenase family)
MNFDLVHEQDINFWGNVYPTYAALPYLRRSQGRVVVNASVESWLPMPRMSLYSVRPFSFLCHFIWNPL